MSGPEGAISFGFAVQVRESRNGTARGEPVPFHGKGEKMQFKSVNSIHADPYRAGAELGEAISYEMVCAFGG